MNVKLLRKVAKHILAEPKRFAMEWWHGEAAPGISPPMFDTNNVAPRCGTVACIAGWSVILSGQKIGSVDDVAEKAKKVLGIDHTQGRRLFGVGWWPDQFGAKYDNCKTRTGRAKIAANRIEHFIKTGE